MLISEHEKYHTMSPAMVGLKEPMYVQVARTTAHTGEQFIFNVPIYPDDSREMAKDRVNFCLSIMQDRVEDENKAVLELEAKAQKSRQAKELIKRNQQLFVNRMKALEKRLKKKQIEQAQFDVEAEEFRIGLKTANDALQEELKASGEEFNPPLPEANTPEVVEDLPKEE